MNILLIEDQAPIRNLIEAIVSELDSGLHVVSTDSIDSLRPLLTGEHWDCILTDYQLQDGNVLELFHELSDKLEGVPKLLMSGYLSREIQERAKHVGFSDFLEKPFHPEELIRWLEQHLNIAKADEPRPCGVKEEEQIRSALFAMDKKVGFLDRILKLSLRHNVSVRDICQHALELAQNIAKSSAAILCMHDKTELVQFASLPKLEETPDLFPTNHRVPLNRTPFAKLLDESEQAIYAPCASVKLNQWPPIRSHEGHYIALPIRLQNKPAGVLCLMGISPVEEQELSEILALLNLLTSQLDITLENKAIHAALEASMKETLIAMARVLDARDTYTKNHSANVSKYSTKIAKQLGLTPEQVETVRIGGLLHDLGKCGIPDSVLLKPGRLTEHEYEVMKTHPVVGYNTLIHIDSLSMEKLIVRNHHERWDGKGYPDGLIGDETPIEVRIVCIADAIDAMTTSRCYRSARPVSFCIEQLIRNSGTQFDPLLVEATVPLLEQGMVRTAPSLLDQELRREANA